MHYRSIGPRVYYYIDRYILALTYRTRGKIRSRGTRERFICLFAQNLSRGQHAEGVTKVAGRKYQVCFCGARIRERETLVQKRTIHLVDRDTVRLTIYFLVRLDIGIQRNPSYVARKKAGVRRDDSEKKEEEILF